MSIAYTVPPAQLTRWFFLKPVKWTVLITTAMGVLLACLLASYIDNRMKNCFKYALHAAWKAVEILFEQSSTITVKLGGARFLIGSAWIVAIVIVATFKGNLVSALGKNNRLRHFVHCLSSGKHRETAIKRVERCYSK